MLIGASLIAGALGLFVEIMLERGDAVLEEEKRAMHHSKVATKLGVITPKPSFIERTWDYVKNNQTRVRVTAAFVAWISAGTIFGVVNQKWDFTTSLYFAITALSTAGLQSPESGSNALCESIQREYPQGTAFSPDGLPTTCPVGLGYNFTAFFVLTGVPVFGLALGQLAGILVERYQRQKQRAALEYQFSESEWAYCNKIGADDGVVDRSEFLIVTLLKMGALDRETLDTINERFDELDVDGNGSFTKNEMHAMLIFDKYDYDGSDDLNIREFACVLDELHYDYGNDQAKLMDIFETWSASYKRRVLRLSTHQRAIKRRKASSW